jgi:hypothetical protein
MLAYAYPWTAGKSPAVCPRIFGIMTIDVAIAMPILLFGSKLFNLFSKKIFDHIFWFEIFDEIFILFLFVFDKALFDLGTFQMCHSFKLTASPFAKPILMPIYGRHSSLMSFRKSAISEAFASSHSSWPAIP